MKVTDNISTLLNPFAVHKTADAPHPICMIWATDALQALEGVARKGFRLGATAYARQADASEPGFTYLHEKPVEAPHGAFTTVVALREAEFSAAAESYLADKVTDGRGRSVFRYEDLLLICSSIWWNSSRLCQTLFMSRLLPRAVFQGKVRSYRENYEYNQDVPKHEQRSCYEDIGLKIRGKFYVVVDPYSVQFVQLKSRAPIARATA